MLEFIAGVVITLIVMQTIASTRRTDQRIRELGGDTAHNMTQLHKERPDLFDAQGRPRRTRDRAEG